MASPKITPRLSPSNRPERVKNKIHTAEVEADNNIIRPEAVKRLIDKYRQNVGDRRNIARSQKWFMEEAKKLKNMRTARIFTGGYKLVNRPRPGQLLLWQYDPLHKATLPYYDRYPLGFIVNTWESKGKVYFSAIQMHYLPPRLRLEAFVALMKLRTEKRYRPHTRLKLEWNLLKSMSQHRLFEAAVKTYILDKKHVMSKFVVVEPADWEICVFLPLQRFVKASVATVYRDSVRKAKG